MKKTENNTTSTIKLSALKNACRNVASFDNDITQVSKEDATLVKQLIKDVEKDNFKIVCKDTTLCSFFIVDNNKNTVCNVYDTMRIQFTTTQAKKYKELLFKDSKKRFYTQTYHKNEFISCKCTTYDELIDAFKFIYEKVYTVQSTEKTTSATKKAQNNVVNK